VTPAVRAADINLELLERDPYPVFAELQQHD
jgi:hypothetical protein